jgi:hypothetical protein
MQSFDPLYFLVYVLSLYMGVSIVMVKINQSRNFDWFTRFEPSGKQSSSSSLSVGMDLRLSSVWTVGQILFVFGIYEFIRHRSTLGEYGQSSFKNRGSSDAPLPNGSFLENGSNDCE